MKNGPSLNYGVSVTAYGEASASSSSTPSLPALRDHNEELQLLSTSDLRGRNHLIEILTILNFLHWGKMSYSKRLDQIAGHLNYPKGLLSGQVAIITGSGQGIGAEAARLFANEGAKVVISDVDASLLSSLIMVTLNTDDVLQRKQMMSPQPSIRVAAAPSRSLETCSTPLLSKRWLRKLQSLVMARFTSSLIMQASHGTA